MKYQWALGFKRGAVASAVAGGLFLGGVIAAPVLAVTSPPTGTIMGRAPTMAPGAITWADTNSTGVVDVGDELSIDPAAPFVFGDVDGDESAGDTYQWLRDGTPIASATASTYKITAEDLGASITLRVTPNTDPLVTDPHVGAPADSTNAIVAAVAGSVYKASISGLVNGVPQVGAELTADALCVSGACDLTNLEYKWQIEGRAPVTGDGTGVFTDIPGATSQKFTPTKDMQKLKVQVVVTNK
ncbi:ZirU family protein [Aeromonas jandaei]|uniref:ZirU family protein n=1 Tax=Aeromonas jandaei TaxID=650 RepID=UPI002B05E94D|nr:ZirU family protein [Aeromonas jandaei]